MIIMDDNQDAGYIEDDATHRDRPDPEKQCPECKEHMDTVEYGDEYLCDKCEKAFETEFDDQLRRNKWCPRCSNKRWIWVKDQTGCGEKDTCPDCEDKTPLRTIRDQA
jgi:DNA-directed RNA polymerase subunit RPC12/RpoP